MCSGPKLYISLESQLLVHLLVLSWLHCHRVPQNPLPVPVPEGVLQLWECVRAQAWSL